MNGFHLAIVAACALTMPMAVDAQSIIESETTRTTLSSSVDAAGKTVLTASVSTERGTGVPGGVIRFVDETTLSVLGWVDVAAPSIVLDRLSGGQHRFRAIYGGTADFLPVVVQPSQSDILIRTIRTAPDITISSSDNPCTPGTSITLTATVAGHGRIPAGTVTLRDGDLVLATHVSLDRKGIASYTTSALVDGERRITAEYEGDAVYAPARSETLLQDVGAVRIRSTQLMRDP